MTLAEIQAAMAVYQILEPEAQKAIAGLIHLIHGKSQATAADLIAQATAIVNANPTKPAGS